MANDPLGREIQKGVEDGRAKANWREPGQKPQSLVNQKSSGRFSHTQGARRGNSWYGISDSHIGPHIHKGERADTPTIGEVMRLREERGFRTH